MTRFFSISAFQIEKNLPESQLFLTLFSSILDILYLFFLEEIEYRHPYLIFDFILSVTIFEVAFFWRFYRLSALQFLYKWRSTLRHLSYDWFEVCYLILALFKLRSHHMTLVLFCEISDITTIFLLIRCQMWRINPILQFWLNYWPQILFMIKLVHEVCHYSFLLYGQFRLWVTTEKWMLIHRTHRLSLVYHTLRGYCLTKRLPSQRSHRQSLWFLIVKLLRVVSCTF